MFIGLVDEAGCELRQPGYHRLDLSRFAFKISPSRNSEEDLVFVNAEPISWGEFSRTTRVAGVVVFKEVDDAEAMGSIPFLKGVHTVYPGCWLTFPPGYVQAPSRLSMPLRQEKTS